MARKHRVEGDTPTKVAIVDLAWAAGFFDGEGYIGVEVRTDRTARLVIVVVQKHPEPLQKVQTLLGGNLRYARGHGGGSFPRWEWKISDRKAAEVLTLLRPYLVVKAAEADIAIAFQAERRQGRRTDPTTIQRAKSALTAIKRRKVVMPVVPVAA